MSTLKYYAPRTQGIGKPNGQMSTKANRHEVLATHLEKHVWNHRDLPLHLRNLFSPGSYTEQAVMMTFARLKTRKAAGPDQLPQKYGNMPFERYTKHSLLAHITRPF